MLKRRVQNDDDTKKHHPKAPKTSAGTVASTDKTPKGDGETLSSAMEYQLGFATGPTGWSAYELCREEDRSLATGSNIKTYFDGAWHDADIPISAPPMRRCSWHKRV